MKRKLSKAWIEQLICLLYNLFRNIVRKFREGESLEQAMEFYTSRQTVYDL